MEIQGSDIFIADWNIPLFMVFYSPGRTTSYPEIPPDSGIRYHYLGGGNEVPHLEHLLVLIKSLWRLHFEAKEPSKS